MKNSVAIFKNQMKEFKSDWSQWYIFGMFLLGGMLLPFAIDSGLIESDYFVYGYGREITLGVGVMFACGIGILILPAMVANHRSNSYLSNHSMATYLIGIGGFYLSLIMVVGAFFAWRGGLSGLAFGNFLLLILLGAMCSMLVGSMIGFLVKNAKIASMIAIPLGVVVLLFSKFRNGVPAFQGAEALRPILDLFYMNRLNYMLMEREMDIFRDNMLVVLVNIVVLSVLLAVLSKVKGRNVVK